jgi:hypothetical protein
MPDGLFPWKNGKPEVSIPTYLCKVKRQNNIDQSYVYVDNFWVKCRCLILILVKKAEKWKANDEPTALTFI